MKNMVNELTLEQEFKLAVLKKEVKKLNEFQSRLYLVELLKQMMIKDNIIKYLIKDITNFDIKN
uniref:phycytochrome bilisome degradation protein n=1 Tax=Pulvinaster venetus TaxID=427767 RepID=UPI001FCCC6CE|nr:phycytochrome bilisome degradation protein [Pulvinaster venetus]UNJ16946.1 phycytochrome bilisome degradation protein [Pulvinaster venetus]